eukprot:547164-Pelagomonas_calceolata.AAC.5
MQYRSCKARQQRRQAGGQRTHGTSAAHAWASCILSRKATHVRGRKQLVQGRRAAGVYEVHQQHLHRLPK